VSRSRSPAVVPPRPDDTFVHSSAASPTGPSTQSSCRPSSPASSAPPASRTSFTHTHTHHPPSSASSSSSGICFRVDGGSDPNN
jgi:hypothetical protein